MPKTPLGRVAALTVKLTNVAVIDLLASMLTVHDFDVLPTQAPPLQSENVLPVGAVAVSVTKAGVGSLSLYE